LAEIGSVYFGCSPDRAIEPLEMKEIFEDGGLNSLYLR
jgi:hypothetical protein